MKENTLPFKKILYGTGLSLMAGWLSLVPAKAAPLLYAATTDTFMVKGTVQIVNNATGKIEGLPATTIMVKGTRIGVLSGGNGDFQLQHLPEQDTITLVFSSVGFFNKEITIINRHAENEMNLGNITMNVRPAIGCPVIKGEKPIKKH